MIDWHSHILPQMDDGSHNVEESISMLNALKTQGIDRVVATPHFNANRESVEDFLRRRGHSYEMLSASMSCDLPQVFCGAEVEYYPGIVRMQGLEQLAIEKTKLLLLEMPMSKWTEYTIKELIELANARGLRIVLAHIERYLAFQEKGILDRLCENGLLIQVNASFFEKIGSRHKAIKLLGSGKIHFVGSDCHNMTSRPPKIGSAYETIERKFGDNFVYQMNEYAYSMFADK